jgi:hypothetical protein
MSIFVQSAAASLNCFAAKARQTKVSLVRAVTMAPNEYSHLSHPSLRAAKGHLARLGEVPLAVPALPRVVPPAICSSLAREYPRARIKRALNDRPVRMSAKQAVTAVGPDD